MRKKRIIFLTTIVFLGFSLNSVGQTTRVLFLGNSYTAANNLPGLFSDCALSAGDTVYADSNTPGGYTFQGHSSNSATLSKISAGNWDYVVLQEQSQLPSFPPGQVQTQVYPYAHQLDSLINLHNPCAETVFYMTWGRKNGDASNCQTWPPVCTYEGMDSLLRLRYLTMASDNNAIVSPVGAVWRYLRTHHPGIELYEADESHPTPEGSYAAACSFYAVTFRKNPQLINFHSTLSAAVAGVIRDAAKFVVYDSLYQWFVGDYDPAAQFSFLQHADSVTFQNLSSGATQYYWEFGDGFSSTDEHPVHQYMANGVYPVTLTAIHCSLYDTITQLVSITGIGIDETFDLGDMVLYPNPSTGKVYFSANYTLAEIFSATGQLLTRFRDGEMLDLQEYDKGIYLIRIFSPRGIQTGRILLY